jgi:hypothetical protein
MPPVDPTFRRSYVPRLRDLRWLALGLALSACAPGATVEDGAAVDPGLVERAVAGTAPARLLHVTFDWSMQDRDARFSGKGVVRIAPPYRGRLDLFGPRGETYIAAVLEEDQLRMPPAALSLLPPPAFLWASLGVFRRPADSLTVARTTGQGMELGFAGARERWHFAFAGDRLRSVEWHGPDGGRRTVELQGEGAHGLPQRGTFRDWQEFRELTLTLTSVEEVNAFPADIWRVGAR